MFTLKKQYRTLNSIETSKSALRANYQYLSQLSSTKKHTDKNSFQNVTQLVGTIQRDLLVHLAESAKRIHVP